MPSSHRGKCRFCITYVTIIRDLSERRISRYSSGTEGSLVELETSLREVSI